MAHFRCTVADQDGRLRTMTRVATDAAVAARELSSEQLSVVEVVELRSRLREPRRVKLSQNELMDLTVTIAHMLDAGLTVQDAFRVARSVFVKGRLSLVVVALCDALEKGKTVAEGLDAANIRMPQVYRGLVRIGERIGTLETVFARLSQYLQEVRSVREKLISAVTYPALVLAIAFVGVTLIGTFLLPKLGDFFGSLGNTMPPQLDRAFAVLRGSAVVVPVSLASGSLLMVSAYFARRRWEDFARAFDKVVLRLPVFGALTMIRDAHSLCFAVEIMTQSGIRLENGLPEAANVVRNRAVRNAVLSVRERLVNGERVSVAFRHEPDLPARMAAWVAVAESTGDISHVFGQLRRFYQGELARWTARFMSLVEPVLIALVGGVVLLLVVFFVLPLLTAYESLL